MQQGSGHTHFVHLPSAILDSPGQQARRFAAEQYVGTDRRDLAGSVDRQALCKWLDKPIKNCDAHSGDHTKAITSLRQRIRILGLLTIWGEH